MEDIYLGKPSASLIEWCKRKYPSTPKYTRVEYVESSGQQYLDTGVDAPTGFHIKIEFELIQSPSSGSPWKSICNGLADTTENYRNYVSLYLNDFNYGIQTYWKYLPGVQSDHRFYLEFNSFSGTTCFLKVNENIYDGQVQTYDQSQSGLLSTVTVFGNASTYETMSPVGKIYSVQLFDMNGTKVRDMIPVKDDNGIPCMYDKITNRFFYSLGSSQFAAGPECQDTTLGYVNDGLILLFDGENNDGLGSHASSTTIWKNLASTHFYANASNPTFGSNYAEFTKQLAQVFSVPGSLQSEYLGSNYSIECVFSVNDGWRSNFSGLAGNHSEDALGLAILQYEDGATAFAATWKPGYVGQTRFNDSRLVTDKIYSASHCASMSDLSAYTYFNGQVDDCCTMSGKLTNTGSFMIGNASEWTDVNRVFSGKLYCMRIYNRRLTPEEVSANYAVDKTRFNIT